jgi:hypothetical protein
VGGEGEDGGEDGCPMVGWEVMKRIEERGERGRWRYEIVVGS